MSVEYFRGKLVKEADVNGGRVLRREVEVYSKPVRGEDANRPIPGIDARPDFYSNNPTKKRS